MKKAYILFFLLFFSPYSFADKEYQYVFTYSGEGLFLREKPSTNSRKLLLIPYANKVEIIDKSGPLEKINDKENNWYKVKFNNHSGWVFSGFLTANIILVSDSIISEYEIFKDGRIISFKACCSIKPGPLSPFGIFHEENKIQILDIGAVININYKDINNDGYEDIILKLFDGGEHVGVGILLNMKNNFIILGEFWDSKIEFIGNTIKVIGKVSHKDNPMEYGNVDVYNFYKIKDNKLININKEFKGFFVKLIPSYKNEIIRLKNLDYNHYIDDLKKLIPLYENIVKNINNL